MCIDIRSSQLSRFKHYSDSIRLSKYYAHKYSKVHNFLQKYYNSSFFFRLSFICNTPENYNLKVHKGSQVHFIDFLFQIQDHFYSASSSPLLLTVTGAPNAAWKCVASYIEQMVLGSRSRK